MAEIVIRKGEEKDLPSLLQLIKELAEFERCPGEVETGLEEMRNWGFGKEKVYGFFVAEKEQRIVGIALYYYKYSTWKGRCLFLEDLIVTEKERGKGYGSRLFEAILDLGKSEKVRRIEWQVLEWNEAALNFYRKYNSVIDSEWLNCRITDIQLQAGKI